MTTNINTTNSIKTTTLDMKSVLSTLLDDIFFAAVEAITAVAIIGLAWMWQEA